MSACASDRIGATTSAAARAVGGEPAYLTRQLVTYIGNRCALLGLVNYKEPAEISRVSDEGFVSFFLSLPSPKFVKGAPRWSSTST